MSSTPPNPPPHGQTPPGGPNTNGQPLRMRRPKKAADPLVRPKKKPIPRPPQPSSTAANGKRAPPAAPSAQPPPRSQASASPSADDLSVNGFSGPLLSETYVDYPLVTTKRAWREAFKFHVAKFASKKNIDPRNEEQFTRPLRLQRRDPRAVVNNSAVKDEDNGGQGRGPTGMMTEAEREDMEAKKLARAKEREENLAQIAPSAAAGGQKRTNAPKQKTQQVFKAEMTPEEITKARIRYEEALPWHLEDFDNKNLWVGNYEAAMSETYAMFALEEGGKMRMVPIDKWYKFSAKNQFRALTIEEVEKHMSKKVKDPRWFMEKEEARREQKEIDGYKRKVFPGMVQATAGGGLAGEDMDFEEDRFADDEEHVGLFDEDEDAQLADKRIKSDQLKANVFDLKDEKEYEQEETKERRQKEALKNYGKRVRKALQKREKNFDYSSGSDANPYSEDESTEDTETERQKDEIRKAEEERMRKEKGKDSERTSGASTKGTNTPSDRPKHTDPLKKAGNLAAARKRPGSPNLSDASGTDTSRKKPKNKHPGSAQALQSQPASRPMSPAPGVQGQQRKPQADASKTKSSKKRVRSGPGSGSDVDRAGSGPDMSDSGSAVPKKLKINLKSSKNGTPTGSRAGSPDAVGRGRTRPSTPRGSPSPSSVASFPTPAEIHAAMPAGGISIPELIGIFKPRIGGELGERNRFITIVKEVGIYTLDDKLVRPKPSIE